jgi:hypothetical protein
MEAREKELAELAEAEDDDVDMIDDVKQMAAAAAASGKEISSFESQLRPIDRYAVRFLELWDPIVDNAVIETPDHIEETEWELDHIEKLKEDMEADIDDDDEPLVYESEFSLSNFSVVKMSGLVNGNKSKLSKFLWFKRVFSQFFNLRKLYISL